MSTYEEEFCARVVLARTEKTKLTQDQMADAITAGRSAYRHYEGGRMTMMPHRLIPKFCEITGTNEDWLLTGKGVMNKGETDWEQAILKKIQVLKDEEERERLEDALAFAFPDKFKEKK